MISFDLSAGHFQARTAAICIQQDCLLIHRDRRMQSWFLPGGRIEIGEASDVSLVREMHEELGTLCQIERLALLGEVLVPQGSRAGNWFHQIGWYYVVTLPGLAHTTQRFAGMAEAADAEFWWCPIAALAAVPLYPQAVRQWVLHPANDVQHFVEAISPPDRHLASPDYPQPEA